MKRESNILLQRNAEEFILIFIPRVRHLKKSLSKRKIYKIPENNVATKIISF